ncbi:hypothetical protein M8I35_10125 [Micromonospora sp. MSM11]|nr:hypothetical protein [Micromonospora sp. MSM11]MCL7457538.1 hypothetical protein [Micromonospora sp. MSM11]
MAGVLGRAVLTALSAAAGVGAGYVTNVLTDAWSWTWGVALAVTSVVLIGSQVWLSLNQAPGGVVAAGRGAVAAGKDVDGDVEVDVGGFGHQAPSPPSEAGVVAAGDGAVAAGRDVRGKLRLRVRRR